MHVIFLSLVCMYVSIDYSLDSYALSFKPYIWSLKEAVVWMFVPIKLNAVKCGKPQKRFASFLTAVTCIMFPV